MSIFTQLYSFVLRRNSTFFLTAMVGAFFFERAVDVGADMYFESHNKGKLWKDIKHKYEEGGAAAAAE